MYLYPEAGTFIIGTTTDTSDPGLFAGVPRVSLKWRVGSFAPSVANTHGPTTCWGSNMTPSPLEESEPVTDSTPPFFKFKTKTQENSEFDPVLNSKM